MEIKSRAIYRYRNGFGWCKHGIVHTFEVDGEMYARDTYSDAEFKNLQRYDEFGKVYPVTKIKNDLEFVMMVEDVKPIKGDEFWLYEEEDRLFVPVGSWHERHLVNKNARKSNENVIEAINDKIRTVESEIKCKTGGLEVLSRFKRLTISNPEMLQKYTDDIYNLRVILKEFDMGR